MLKKIFSYITIIISLSIFEKINAQTAPRVSIQGTLKDNNGAATVDGTYTITFKLYDQPTGGTALWSEVASVDVAGGIYSHYLGSVVPLNTTHFSSTLFLGVNVGTLELSPRTELTYAPYAFAVYQSECSGALGDIKFSMLNPTQFAAVNGSCWVPMDGRSISGSALKNLMNLNNIPDGSGLFLRAQEYAGGANNDPDRTTASTIGTFQNSQYIAHNHGLSDPGHGHSFNDKWRKISGDNYSVAGGNKNFSSSNTYETIANNTNNASTGVSLSASGGAETRPKNLNAWLYIRIN